MCGSAATTSAGWRSIWTSPSRDFEKRHVVEVTKKGEKRIKEGYKTCQFLDENHMCSVYEARPHDCRGYVCWNQPDETVYGYAVFLQTGVAKLREQEK